MEKRKWAQSPVSNHKITCNWYLLRKGKYICFPLVCPWVYQPHSCTQEELSKAKWLPLCVSVGRVGTLILFWKWQILKEQTSIYGKSWYEKWMALPGLFERFSKISPVCHSWAWPHVNSLCDLWQSSELLLPSFFFFFKSQFCKVGLRSEFLQLDRMTLRARTFDCCVHNALKSSGISFPFPMQFWNKLHAYSDQRRLQNIF